MVHKPQRLTTSMAAAAAATIISAASLFIAWRQSALMERQLAASVWPALAWDSSNASADSPTITMSFQNNGIGPARILAFDMQYQDKPVRTWVELLATCCGGSRTDASDVISARIIGRVLGPNQKFTFFAMQRTPQNQRLWERLDAARLQIQGHVCYCSAVDECWSLDAAEVLPKAVSDCSEAGRRPQYNSW